jgi:hypothetical protein
MHQFLKFISEMKLYMFRTVPLSIIRSYSLYTQQWYVIQVCRQLSSRIRIPSAKKEINVKVQHLSMGLHQLNKPQNNLPWSQTRCVE